MATDHDFKIKNGLQVENGFLLIGKEALSNSDGYMGMKTSNMTGVSDYMIISGTGDNNTYLSAKDGASVYIRGGGNSSTHQLRISSASAQFYGNLQIDGNLTVNGTTLTVDTTNLQVQDNNITLNYSTGDSSSSANGAGITIQDAVSASTNATILWDASSDRFEFSNGVDVENGGAVRVYRSGNSAYGELRFDTGENLDLFSSWGSKYLRFTRDGHLQLSGTTRIAHNGDATLGTISSGAITSTGNITGAALIIDGNTAVDKSGSNYMVFYDGSGGPALYAGNSSDNRNYYQSNHHRFRSDDANTTFAELSSAGLRIGGASTPAEKLHVESGNIRVDGAYLVNGTTVIDSARTHFSGTKGYNTTATGNTSTTASTGIKQTYSEGWTALFADYEPYHEWGLYHDNPANDFYVTAGTSTNNIGSFTVVNHTGNNRTAYKKIRFDQDDGTVWAGGGYYVGTSQVLDTSRNLTNIGTISASGAITSTSGSSSFLQAIVTSGGLRVAGGGTYSDHGNQMYLHADSSGYGRIAVYDLRLMTGSNNSRVESLRIDNSGNVNVSRGALQIGGTTVIDSSGNFNALGNIKLDSHKFVDQEEYSGTSIFSQSGDWYTLAEISETTTPAYFALKFGAHSTVTFSVTTGYVHSNVATINVLGSTWTQNGGYPGASELRIVKQTDTSAYYLQMRLTYSSGPTAFSLYARTWGATPSSGTPSLVSSLSAYSATHTTIAHVYTDYNGTGSSTANYNNNGSNSLPSYSFSGDTNTGMYRDTADSISFATNGTLRTTISNSGLDVKSGEFKINGVTVINSSRQLRNITAMRIGATEIIDSNANLTNIGTISSGAITSSGNLHAGDDTDISMNSSANGQLEVDGNGYQGAIALDGSAMHIYHNSSSRGLVLGTDETARLTIGGTGGFNFHSNNLASVGTISSGAITATGASTFDDVYANDWFRNNNAGEGLYNQSTSSHFYSAGSNFWHINPSSAATSSALIFYGAYNSSQGNSTNRKGYVYWDSSGFGLLSSDGSWAYRHDNTNADIYGTNIRHNATNIMWHAGNDGSGSGLDADLFDGLDSTSFARSNAGTNYTNYAHIQRFYSNSALDTGASSQSSLEVYNGTAGNDAFMSFHVSGDYALYFGLDGGTNDLAVGGWSKGANSYKVWHAANDGSGSGLDADTLDGVQAASFLRSDANDSYAGILTVNGMNFMNDSNTARNFKMKTNDSSTTDVGLSLYTGAGAHAVQLYGVSTQYGFLDGNWASWDLRKTKNGAFEVDEGSGLQRVWNAGNDGSGSGLDADTLDGVQGASFLRSDANDSFTGQLTMSTQKALIASNYGHGVYGVYSAVRYQHVWSMGTSYNLPADGQDESGAAGNLYGLAWTYNPNYSYSGSNPQAKAGLNHQLLLMMNGITYTALGNGIWTSGSISRNGNTVWDAGNDGAGSGLDADTLDGWHLSAIKTNSGTDSNQVYIRNSSPTIYLRDTDHISSMIHQNSDRFYILRGDAADDTGWTAHASGAANNAAGRWPLEMNISDSNNYVSFASSNLSAGGYSVWHTGNDGAGSGLDADNLDGVTWGDYKSTGHIQLNVQANNGYGLRFWNGNDNYKISMAASNTTGFGRQGFEPNSDYNMYFRMNAGTNRGFVFQDGTSNKVGIDAGGNIRADGIISSNNKQAMNCAHWSASGTSTGAIKIALPGTTSNFSMPVIEVTTYDYSAKAHVIYNISGHNWSTTSYWYNTRVTSEGGPPLTVRLGHDGTTHCIFIGDTNTSWSYGSVTVALKAHPAHYASNQNFTTGWGISQVTSLPSTITAVTVGQLWHSANDGAGSGLDADSLDGMNASSSVSNSTIVARDSNSYIYASHINFSTSESENPSINSFITSNGDGWSRKSTKAHVWSSISSQNAYNNLSSSTGSGANLNNTFITASRSGNFDCWSGSNFPPSTTHVQGIQVRHSTSSHYGWQLASQYNQPGKMYLRHVTNSTFYDWHTMWSSQNDGSGSGLDADLLDGYHSAENGASVNLRTGSNGYLYLDNWLRVGNSTGLYTADSGYFYRNGAYWGSRGTSSSATGTQYQTVDGTTRGYVYATNSNEIGFLDNAGSWAVRYTSGGTYMGATQNIRINSSSTTGIIESTATNMVFRSSGGGGHNFQRSGGTPIANISNVGDFTALGNVTAYGSPSDINLKENIETISNAVEKVQKLDGVTFNYKKDGGRSTGLIAQQLQEVLPEVVYTTEDLDGEEHLAVRYGNTVGLLVEAIKELKQEINELKAQLKEK